MIIVPLWFLLAAVPPTTAEGIMLRVALNQDRDQEMRTASVYHQNVMVRLHRANVHRHPDSQGHNQGTNVLPWKVRGSRQGDRVR